MLAFSIRPTHTNGFPLSRQYKFGIFIWVINDTKQSFCVFHKKSTVI